MSWGISNPTLPGWTKIGGEAYEQVNSGYGGVNASEGLYWLDLDSSPGTALMPAMLATFTMWPDPWRSMARAAVRVPCITPLTFTSM